MQSARNEGNNSTEKNQWIDRIYWTVIGLILLGGVFLRVNRYVFNRSLWLDEAFLAINIVERSPTALIGELTYGQQSPIGFSLMVKWLSQIFGYQETVLRLIPLISGIASLLLFYRLIYKSMPRWVVVITLLLFAASDRLGDYSAQFKPYSSDVVITLVLIIIASWFWQNSQSPRQYLLFSLVGMLSVWISFPASIVLAGIGFVLMYLNLKRKDYVEFQRFIAVAGTWLASFSIVFFLHIRHSLQNDKLTQYWQNSDSYFPFPISGLSDIELTIRIFVQIFEDPLGFALYSGVVLLFLLGVIDLLQDGVQKLFIISPIVISLVFSMMKVYPFSGRLMLFEIPLLLIVTTSGLKRLSITAFRNKNVKNAFVCVLVSLLMFQPIRTGLGRGINPRKYEEMRPIMFQLKDEYLAGDVVAVYYAAQYAFKYYAYLLDFQGIEPIIIREHGDSPSDYFQEINPLRGNNRVWVVFSHKSVGIWGPEEPIILHYLDEIGQKQSSYEEIGASLYLYDLNSLELND